MNYLKFILLQSLKGKETIFFGSYQLSYNTKYICPTFFCVWNNLWYVFHIYFWTFYTISVYFTPEKHFSWSKTSKKIWMWSLISLLTCVEQLVIFVIPMIIRQVQTEYPLVGGISQVRTLKPAWFQTMARKESKKVKRLKN